MPTIAIRPTFHCSLLYSWGASQILFLEKNPDLHLHLLLRSLRLQIYSQWKRHETKEMIQTLKSNSRWLLVTLWHLVEAFDVSLANIEVLEVFIKSLEAWKNRFTKTSSFRGAKLKPGKSTDALKANVWKECFPLFQSSAHAHVLVEGWLSDKLRRFWGAPQLLFLEKKPGLHLHFLLESLWWYGKKDMNEGDGFKRSKAILVDC